MIKKLIGILVAVAVIVVIVFAALHHDNYSSMLSSSTTEEAVAIESPAQELPEAVAPASAPEIPVQAPADSTAVHVVDSIAR